MAINLSRKTLPMKPVIQEIVNANKAIEMLGGPLQLFSSANYARAFDVADNAGRLLRRAKEAREPGLDLYVTWNEMQNNSRLSGSKVKEYRAFFVDFDCGRDESGSYFPLESVESFVSEKLDQLKSFACPPNFTLRTRNGIHAVWVIHPEQRQYFDEVRFRGFQMVLSSYFGSDPVVKEGNRLMRCPLSFWEKRKEGIEDFRTHFDLNNYDLADANDILDAAGYADNYEEETAKTTACVTVNNECSNSSEVVAAVKNLDLEFFKKRVEPVKLAFMNRKIAVEYLKTNINLGAFLELPVEKSFRCIFHHDRKPSADILPPSQKYTYWFYNCKSSNCNVKGTIIDVVMRLSDVSAAVAINFLFDVFGIRYGGRKYYDLAPGDVSVTEATMRLKKNFKNLVDRPELCKTLTPLRCVLNAMCKIAKESANRTNTEFLGENCIFYASKRYLAEKMGENNDGGKAFKKLTLLTAFGFIERIPDEEIPAGIRKTNGKWLDGLIDIYSESIQFFRLLVVDNCLDDVIEAILSWKKAGIAINRVSFNTIATIYGYD